MRCPKCDTNQRGPDAAGKSVVKNVRHYGEDSIRRRYQCWACGHRWTTWERIEEPAELRELMGQKFLSI